MALKDRREHLDLRVHPGGHLVLHREVVVVGLVFRDLTGVNLEWLGREPGRRYPPPFIRVSDPWRDPRPGVGLFLNRLVSSTNLPHEVAIFPTPGLATGEVDVRLARFVCA